MRISPPALFAYDCTFEKALDIIWTYRLRNCEPRSEPVLMLGFPDDADLLHFKMAFGEDIDFADEFAFVRPAYQGRIESFLAENGIESRVTRRELIAVTFWDTDDKVAFDAELSILSPEP